MQGWGPGVCRPSLGGKAVGIQNTGMVARWVLNKTPEQRSYIPGGSCCETVSLRLETEIIHWVSGLNEALVLNVSLQKEIRERQSDR